MNLSATGRLGPDHPPPTPPGSNALAAVYRSPRADPSRGGRGLT